MLKIVNEWSELGVKKPAENLVKGKTPFLKCSLVMRPTFSIFLPTLKFTFRIFLSIKNDHFILSAQPNTKFGQIFQKILFGLEIFGREIFAREVLAYQSEKGEDKENVQCVPNSLES